MPDERRRAAEVLRSDADDAVVATVDADHAPEDVGVESVPFPVGVTGDDRGRLADRPLFLAREDAPARQADAERLEVLRRYDVDERPAGRLALCDAGEGEVVGRHAGKRPHRITDVGEVRIRKGPIRVGQRPVGAVEPDDGASRASPGRGRRRRPLRGPNTPALTPIPRARTATAVSVKPGCRPSRRRLYRMSRTNVCMRLSDGLSGFAVP